MKQILDEYGEAAMGMIAALLITILAVALFKDGGILEGFMSSVVNKGLKVEIFPDKAMEHVLNQNMGNARFTWNNILNRYNKLLPIVQNPTVIL